MKTFDSSGTRLIEEKHTGKCVNAGYQLMLRASSRAAAVIRTVLDTYSRAVVLAGKGNNGGDALCVASLLYNSGFRNIVIYSVCGKEQYSGEAAMAVRDLAPEIPFLTPDELFPEDFMCGDIVVDGLLGIGFSGTEVRGRAASFIRAVNAAKVPVISLDVPSGLDASDGRAAEPCISAAATLMFGTVKSGVMMSPQYSGKTRFIDIGIAQDIPENCGVYTQYEAFRDLSAPAWNAHKNSRPRVLIFAGCRKYSGAAYLNMLAALRSGAGICRLVTAADFPAGFPLAGIVHRCMSTDDSTYPSEAVSDNFELFEKSDVVIAGSGWGNADKKLLSDVLSFPGPVVLDADFLNTLSRHPESWNCKHNAVLTPHLGEARRLAAAFGITDDKNLAAALAEKLQCTVILKGPHTVCASCDGSVWQNISGSSALATAGSGDVLAGIVGSCIAGVSSADSICRRAACAVWIHGCAGEMARGSLIADDLPELAGQVIEKTLNNKIIPIL